ncbi:related to carboxyphosphonoenolpyruvate phosphonomutase [Ustilago sp. UG-2017a]|nr:related to carboxyphosphonoenolpyruvate phosphonomutase [Ustilago sp. UG-2017a]
MMTPTAPHTSAAKLRHLLSTLPLVIAPGVFDGISARLAIKTGHHALYQTGAGTSASRLARADLGFLSLSDMTAAAGVSITADPSLLTPVIADADTGFGGPPQVARTVLEYHRAGIAALHIEDQVTSKRCGHLNSKQLVDTDTFISRITAAANASNSLPCPKEDRILIIARTDALADLGLEEAIERLKKARDAGAEMGFLEGLRSDQEARTAIQALAPWPLLANCVTGGKSLLWTAKEVERLGFKLAIFPTAGIFAVQKALEASYSNLAERGIGIEAEKGEEGRVDLGGADSAGLRKFFVDMGLEDELGIDRLAAGGALGDA